VLCRLVHVKCGLTLTNTRVATRFATWHAVGMRDVKEVHTAVKLPTFVKLPSAFLYEKEGEGGLTYESEVSSPSVRHISSMCR